MTLSVFCTFVPLSFHQRQHNSKESTNPKFPLHPADAFRAYGVSPMHAISERFYCLAITARLHYLSP